MICSPHWKFLLVVVAMGSIAAEDSGLRWNPFERPDATDGSSDRSESWRPELRATLVDGADSMANLGGKMLRIGESHREYTLIEVRAWEAVFERAGTPVTLRVKAAAARRRGR